MTAPHATDDASWVARARAGDREAFRVLVDRHRDRAFRLALRVVRSAADAEEVAQDAFVRAWRALPRFRGDASFGTWLHRIVVRQAVDRATRLDRRRRRETPLSAAAEREPEATAPAPGALGSGLERLVGRLSPSQRAAVTLFYEEDRPVAEIARVLGMPENTVKTHLARARRALREAWIEESRE